MNHINKVNVKGQARDVYYEFSTGRQRHACISSAARGQYGQFWRIIHAYDLCHNRRIDNFACCILLILV